ncbi:DUF86 domain-containing protein [Bifidobacterium aerophilum]|uniref:DUF86 domain-containing protein n=1 Tax=Bifidobacterium aerophilum TaxID=1798155 RepID=A0A6N9Z4U1_9BIFI|nr:HepT-like ribonuclease domain-containing protein [Bifidobacterium aerophilum]NEG89719.1 DUF86 domain-containing protein [Bifidobacterium aerophilum]
MGLYTGSTTQVHHPAIIRAMRDAQRFLGNMTLAEFNADDKTQNAVAMAVARVGEHVKGLSRTFRDAESETEWKAIAGTRDWIVHDYDELDFARLHQAVTQELPHVIDVLQPYVDELQHVTARTDALFDVPRI